MLDIYCARNLGLFYFNKNGFKCTVYIYIWNIFTYNFNNFVNIFVLY